MDRQDDDFGKARAAEAVDKGAGVRGALRCDLGPDAGRRVGVQAALCAKPEDVENCKPRTELGKVVRGLVVEACKGRSTAMKTLLRFLEYVEDEEIAALQRTLPDIEWDWSPDGVWLTKPEAVEEEEEGEGKLGAGVKRPRASAFTTEELFMSRQQRRYLARLHEKKTARPDAVPILS